MRLRVPGRFVDVEPLREINRSLKTRDYEEAKARFVLRKKALTNEWEARLARGRDATSPEAFDLAVSMLDDIGISYRPMDDLVSGPIQELLDRIEAVGKSLPDSVQVSAALGALDLPQVLVSEMPSIVEELEGPSLTAKNDRQMRQWRNKYKFVAQSFCAVVADKPVTGITEQEALAFRKHWRLRRDKGEITTDHAVKRLRHMRQLVHAYYERFDVPLSQRKNPFAGLKIEKIAADSSSESRKLALPSPWVERHVINQEGLEALNEEARDIATIAAECGTRQSEVYDLAPGDIHLDDQIPHIMVQVVSEGQFKREIKNSASKRPVILFGAALAAMRRHPEGFPRYRGGGSYSGTVNKYLQENELLPASPEGDDRTFTIGCTRHTFEDRMKHAKMSNEERAYLMGHSIGKVRGRPVYGNDPDLQMRALYQEMVSYPTESWKPRSIRILREELDRVATELGFRVE